MKIKNLIISATLCVAAASSPIFAQQNSKCGIVNEELNEHLLVTLGQKLSYAMIESGGQYAIYIYTNPETGTYKIIKAKIATDAGCIVSDGHYFTEVSHQADGEPT